MVKFCPVCGDKFNDGDKLAALFLAEYKEINSEVSFATTEPTTCLEIFHAKCYDYNDDEEDN